jgi:prepilin-type N-terminal cleavage/methylation domain-containing protein
MKLTHFGQSRGFTLIELLVVISIIAILSLGILTALYNARKESRDLARMSDVQQLKLVIKLYKEAQGIYPVHAAGIEIGAGRAIDAQLRPFVAKINRDPLGVSPYGYWYHSAFNCTQASQRVILVRKVENIKNANFDKVCGAGIPSGLPAGWNRSEVFVTLLN